MEQKPKIEQVDQLADLLFRHLRNELNEQDAAKLTSWANETTENQEWFARMSSLDYQDSRLKEFYETGSTGARDRVKKMIDEAIGNTNEAPVKTRPAATYLFRLAVAAALLGVVVLGYFLVVDKADKKNKPAVAALQNDVLPGGDKATLTLANGATIMLDSASSGKLAEQGQTTVTKSADGKLVYNVREDDHIPLVYNKLTTPRGGQYQVSLPDGTRVWLNAASSIRYPTAFSGSERRVEMTGEAYFEVMKDAKKPFVVNAAGVEAQVLGTSFNVNAYPDENALSATLLEGSLKVSSRIMTPGQQVEIKGNTTKTKMVDTQQVIAWKNNYFSFHNASIEEVMRQFQHWYDIDVVYEGKVQPLLNGHFKRSNNLSVALKILQSATDVHLRIEGKKVVVSP